MNLQRCYQQLDQLEKELDRLQSVLSIQIQGSIQERVHRHEKQLEKVEKKLKKTSLEIEKKYSSKKKFVV